MKLIENEKPKGEILLDGLKIYVEYKKGDKKTGVNKATGEEWTREFFVHYGYFDGVPAPDGDNLDVYIKPKSRSNRPVYVFHNLTPTGDKFDEDKVFLGCNNLDEAKILWNKHCHAPDIMFGGVSVFTIEEFKNILDKIDDNNKCVIASKDNFNYLKNNNLLPENLTSLAFNEYLEI